MIHLKNFFRDKMDSYTFSHGVLDCLILVFFALFLFFLTSCTVIDPQIQPLKLECDSGECSLRPNLLICDEENIFCTYIDTPILPLYERLV